MSLQKTPRPRRRASAFCAGTAMALVLQACGPDGALPPARIDLPAAYAGQVGVKPGRLTPAPVPDAATAQWWRGFKDPMLEALIARGLSGNVTLQIAQARLAEVEAEARAARLPFSDSLSLTTTKGEFSTTDAGELAVSVPVAGQGARRSAALARIEAARYGDQDARLKLLGELTSAYVDLRFLQAQQVQAQMDLASRRKTVDSLKARLALEAATRLDILSAEALVAETEARIPTLSAQIARAHGRIATLLGQPAATLGLDLAWTGRQPQLAAPKAYGIPADLVRRRPDIRVAEARYAEAVAAVGQARAAFFPSLTLSGTISATRGLADPSRSFGLGLALPLLSLPAVKAQEEAAMARAEQAYLSWRLAVLTAVEEVEAGLAEVAGARSAAARTERAVAINAEALDLSRQLMESRGDVTALMLLDRERSLSAARVTRAQALRDYARGVIALNVALGLGPDPQVAPAR